jgi:hypothetical protein
LEYRTDNTPASGYHTTGPHAIVGNDLVTRHQYDDTGAFGRTMPLRGGTE